MGAWIEILELIDPVFLQWSHPTMGAWIEICGLQSRAAISLVAPHDGCVDWNKEIYDILYEEDMSHPTMGAWIEIIFDMKGRGIAKSRTPRWVRGLK